MSGHDDTYQLGVLLELRERAQSDAEEELARAQQELTRRRKAAVDARAARDAAAQRVLDERRAMDERIACGDAGVTELAMFDGYMRGLREDVADAELRIEDAEAHALEQVDVVSRAQAALADAVRELEAVRQHEKNWKAEREVVARRRESSAMDDVAARIWREKNQ